MLIVVKKVVKNVMFLILYILYYRKPELLVNMSSFVRISGTPTSL